jgi:hypothetical protein
MKIWIVASATTLSLGLAFAGGHDIRAQLLGQTSEAAAVDSSITLPAGYRDWPLISVAAVGPPVNDLRAKLGNDVAMADLRQGTIPYRDGAIIARLAWKQTSDPQTSNAIRLQAQQVGLSPDAIAKLLSQSFIAGPATNVQFMVKDSKKYASTGGWGFAQFTNGKPDAIVQRTCFACHEPAKATDFVFTQYSP